MKYYSSGKVLLSGEYLVLDGAYALALPTVFGQVFEVTPSQKKHFSWKSYDHDNSLWFEAKLSLNSLEILETNNPKSAKTLQKLLQFIRQKKPELFHESLSFITKLEFSKDWGLGSSATFIVNLSKWSKVDAFVLSNISLGGSGYDIAVANLQKPLVYNIDFTLGRNHWKPHWNVLNDLKYKFADKIWFVYLNQKQNSREGIKSYKELSVTQSQIDIISNISMALSDNKISYEKFCQLLEQHEKILSNVLQRPTIKQELFSDFKGTVKNLGAWGGDFVIATGNDVSQYFKSKGYQTIIAYKDFIRNTSQ